MLNVSAHLVIGARGAVKGRSSIARGRDSLSSRPARHRAARALELRWLCSERLSEAVRAPAEL